jgi:predicted nucleotidyltransferase
MYSVTVDDDKITVLAAIDTVSAEFAISWFLCGAYSRVLLCEEVFKIPIGRATYDLDIAICVKSLDEYTFFRLVLCEKHLFESHSKIEHRLIHRPSGIPVDIIPFGKFSGPDELYSWGSDDAFEMNVRGFNDASLSAISFLVNSELEIKLAGYAEQFVLKLFAWKDRRQVRGIDDAGDLAYFLIHALKSVSEKDLYGKYHSVLREAEYDDELASCYFLGKQIRYVFSMKTVDKTIEILEGEFKAGDDSALMSDMYSRFSSWPQPDERISTVINQVLKGLFADDY